jgi:hypothetical protein
MEINKVDGISITLIPSQPQEVRQLGRPPQKEKLVEAQQIRNRIAKEFGILVADGDVRFTGAEVQAIDETLKKIRRRKRKHLIGVKEIIKSRRGRIKLLEAASIHAGGAYVPEKRRIYIFDEVPEKNIGEVLTHEVGHAVNYYNLAFSKFMEFVQEGGWNIIEFRPIFIAQNKFFQFSYKRIDTPQEEWANVWGRFTLDSLARGQDVEGAFVVELDKRQKMPWDKNPLERFAWAYEWFVNHPEEFNKLAQKAKKLGDETWEKELEFIKEEVF